MSFGRNPHVAKAEAAEQKALAARDAMAGEQAWRDAARQWERAAERETDGKRKQSYLEKAEAARQQADAPGVDSTGPTDDEATRSRTTAASAESSPAASRSAAKKPSSLN